MPGLILHVSAQMKCLHAGQCAMTTPAARVLVGGSPAAAVSPSGAPPIGVTGCLFQVPVPGGTKPQPCVTVKWANLSTRVTSMGMPLLLQPPPGTGAGAGVGQSLEQIPQGAPAIAFMQPRVSAM
jgi:hypothetical protein